ncbi:MAG: GHKL domain-containing protein [Lachnospiraceae bacterium]|nr:GHKL domain-containing protein [Lachnospiraceae bacterium]
MREILFECVTVLLYVVQGIVLAQYCGRFAGQRFEGHWTGKYGIAVAWVLSRELVSNLWKTEYQPGMTIAKQLFFALLLYGMIFIFYKTYLQMGVYLCVTYTAIGEISLFLLLEITPFEGYVFEFAAEMMEAEKWTYEFTLRFINGAAVVMQLLVNVFYMLVFGLLIRVVADRFQTKKESMNNRDLLYLISPALTGWLLGLLLRSMLYTLEDGVPQLLYDRYPVLHVLAPFMWITILGGIVLTNLFYQDMVARNEQEFAMRMLKQQVDGLQAQLREVERVNAASRSWRHDMKNILSVAMQLSGDMQSAQKLRQYLSDAEQSIREADFRFRTGDSAVDSLLNMKYYSAVSRVPDLKFDAEEVLLPGSMQISSFDLCLILGNALDNAIEACERLYRADRERKTGSKYFIYMTTKVREQTILLEIQNSFDGELHLEKTQKYPQTMKDDKAVHGIGMRNMKQLAQKYFGEVAFQAESGVFTLWISLQNCQPDTK